MKEANYPVLERLESSEFDEKIEFAYNSICKHQLCWMAFEYLEELFVDKKLKKGLFFSKEKNTIAIRSKTHRLLARIWFEPKSVAEGKKIYQWSLE
ncbi:MAG: hypothetical protein AAGA02_02850 [Bacteroidota bacterium]